MTKTALILSLLLVGCWSSPKKSDDGNTNLGSDFDKLEDPSGMKRSEIRKKEVKPKDDSSDERSQEFEIEPTNIDFDRLHTSLGLDRGRKKTGFKEKEYNTCDVGFGYSGTQNCVKRRFVSIHFRLVCRESEETVSEALTESDFIQLKNRQINWSLGGTGGQVDLDEEGYGQIRKVYKKSMRSKRLKLATNGNFLYQEAGEVSRIVAPHSWCD